MTMQLTTAPRPTLNWPTPPRRPVHQIQARAQRSGGPEDRALYSCSCGYAFKAEVSTSVGCPRCGNGQAW